MLPARSTRRLRRILIVFYTTTVAISLSFTLFLSLFLPLVAVRDDEDTCRMPNGDGARVSGSREWSLRGLMRGRRVGGSWEGRRDRVHVDRATAAT